MSVASFLSVYGDDFHNTPTTSTKAAVSGSFGKVEKTDLCSIEVQRTKCETLHLHRLPTGSNRSNSSQERQHSSSNCPQKQELKLKLELHRIKMPVEQYQTEREDGFQQLQENAISGTGR